MHIYQIFFVRLQNVFVCMIQNIFICYFVYFKMDTGNGENSITCMKCRDLFELLRQKRPLDSNNIDHRLKFIRVCS